VQQQLPLLSLQHRGPRAPLRADSLREQHRTTQRQSLPVSLRESLPRLPSRAKQTRE
jgi:hypothetical protein